MAEQTEPSPWETMGGLIAQTGAASMFQGLAIVGALAEARTIDPLKVAAWADVFAGHPTVSRQTADQVRQFAELIRSLVKVPPVAGKAQRRPRGAGLRAQIKAKRWPGKSLCLIQIPLDF